MGWRLWMGRSRLGGLRRIFEMVRWEMRWDEMIF